MSSDQHLLPGESFAAYKERVLQKAVRFVVPNGTMQRYG